MKQKIKKIMLLIPFFSLVISCSHLSTEEHLPSNLEYFFYDLQIKDYEAMRDLIRPWIKKSSKAKQNQQLEEARVYIHQALLLILSKPQRDHVNKKLLQKIQRESQLGGETFFQTLATLSNRAMVAIKNKERSIPERATYLYVLENTIEELKFYVNKYSSVQKILTSIGEANIKIPSEIHEERYIRSLEPRKKSPSVIAKKILKLKGA